MTLSPLAFDANWQKVCTGSIMFIHSILNLIFIEEKEEEIPDVDDTDGLDPAAEFEAWRLRELGRIKTEKEAELQREKEREEVERRRAMPAEQRMKEDLERAQKLRDEKPKGQQKFLQKYWHKGAFHQVMYLLVYIIRKCGLKVL
jgi:microfibrillar-associated protein 1